MNNVLQKILPLVFLLATFQPLQPISDADNDRFKNQHKYAQIDNAAYHGETKNEEVQAAQGYMQIFN